jgi:DNA primase
MFRRNQRQARRESVPADWGAPMIATIDFAGIRQRVSLERIIADDLGAPFKRSWRCPFHDDHNPSLSVDRTRGTWRCWSCGERGDVLDWLVKRGKAPDVVAAARLLDPTIPQLAATPTRVQPAPSPAPQAPATDRAEPWQDREWQRAANQLVCDAEAALWAPEGGEAIRWLKARGLARSTIRRFRLGFVSSKLQSHRIEILVERGCSDRITASCGIAIPWLAPGTCYADPKWVGVNVRQLNADVWQPWMNGDKYRAVRGSRRGYPYPFDEVVPGIAALVTEGEFDALLAWQECGWLVNSLTIGGARQRVRPTAERTLAACPWLLIATDHDAAGTEAAAEWRAYSPVKVRRLFLPSGKDLSDYHAGGGVIRQWIAGELDRLGIATTAHATQSSPGAARVPVETVA